MTVWTLLALGAILAAAAVEAGATLANLRALDPEVPADFRHVYDAGRYRRSQDYTRASARVGLVADAVSLALLLGFWLAGGFGWLDAAVRAPGLGKVATGLLFLAALGLAQAVVALPFRWWQTFVVEDRFGFNRTTPRTFCADVAKGALLAILLGGPLVAAVLWLFTAAGPHAWLWCWLVATAWTVAVQFVAPTWLLPLFNRFTPLESGGLRDAILGYAERAGFPVAGVWVIDGSRRSTKANAFFTGFGRTKRIALFDTLLRTLAPEEILAVVAHEVGHYKRRHVVVGMGLAVAHLGLTFLLLSLALGWPPLYAAFGVAEPSVHAGLVLFALVFAPVELLLSVALHALSRRHEYQADAFAVATTGSGERLATALERLSAESLANVTPHPLHVALHHSHPPVRQRVRRLRGLSAARSG